MIKLVVFTLFSSFAASETNPLSLGDRRYGERDGGVSSAQAYPAVGQTQKGQALFGKCVIVNAELPTFEAPCPDGIVLEATDATSKSAGSTRTVEGRFSLPAVKPGASYFLKVKSAGFQPSADRLGPFKNGEEPLIRLHKAQRKH